MLRTALAAGDSATTSQTLPLLVRSLAALGQALASGGAQCSQRCYSSSGASTSDAQPSSQAGESLNEIRARVFQYHLGNGRRSGRKPLMQPLIGAKLVNYYWRHPSNLPLLEDDQEAE
jgi:hypothetical protein